MVVAAAADDIAAEATDDADITAGIAYADQLGQPTC